MISLPHISPFEVQLRKRNCGHRRVQKHVFLFPRVQRVNKSIRSDLEEAIVNFNAEDGLGRVPSINKREGIFSNS